MKNKNRNNKGVLFLTLIFVIVLGVVAFLTISLRVDTVNESLKYDSVIKTLFVLEDEGNVLFTDILIYYPVSKRGALINILGNTGGIYKSIDRTDRIDSIYVEKGIETYKSEIENLIGQTIHFYVEMNLNDFAELTDLLGGLKVFVPSPVDVTDENKNRYLLPSGSVNLDGDKIITYLTYSKEDETEDEIVDRRQNVMIAFLSALNKNSSKLLDKRNFSHYSEKLKSNLKEKDLHSLFAQISNVDAERLVPQAITGTKRLVDGKVLLFPFYDGRLIKEVVNQATNTLIALDDISINRIYVLEIQNGTSVQGLARNTAALLRSAGYDVLSTINAERNDFEETQIINHIGNKEIAKNLGDFIHCTNIIDEEIKTDAQVDGSNENVDFTIILGKDFDGRYVKKSGGK